MKILSHNKEHLDMFQINCLMCGFWISFVKRELSISEEWKFLFTCPVCGAEYRVDPNTLSRHYPPREEAPKDE